MTENMQKTNAMQQPVYRLTLLFILPILGLYLIIASLAWGDYQAGVAAYKRKDYVKALKEFQPLAEQGDADTQLYLAKTYYALGDRYNSSGGWGHWNAQPRDASFKCRREAFKDFQRLAKQGNTYAQYRVGKMYQYGWGVQEDDIEAEKWLRKAYQEWRQLAEQGYAEAQYHLFEGYPLEKNEVEENKWLRKAAEQGHAEAQDTLGRRYAFDSDGDPKKGKEAVEGVQWLRKAAEQGHAEAQGTLGKLYMYGFIVQKNDVEAAKWLHKAAEKHAYGGVDEFAALSHLAAMYESGTGVRQDYAEAARWYRRGAQQGKWWDALQLAGLYFDGKGVSKDYVEAHMWLSLADEGSFYGIDGHKILKKKTASIKEMTAAQFAEVERRVKEWKRANDPFADLPSYPPDLIASIRFSEPSGNNFLDANEKGTITVTVENRGKGSGAWVRVTIAPEKIEGLSYDHYDSIRYIPPEDNRWVKIPVEASIQIADATHMLIFNFREENNFPPEPVQLKFSTKSYVKPKLVVVDVGVDEPSGNGMIESAEVVTLTVRTQNQGAGDAKAAHAKVFIGDNVFIAGNSKTEYALGDLKTSDYMDFSFSVYTNKTATELPVFVEFTEATGLVEVKRHRLPISLNQRVKQMHTVVVKGQDAPDLSFAAAEKLSIDIEQNIPLAGRSNPDAVAVVIGISDYQNSTVPSVDYAKRDAQFVREYLIKTFGYDSQNILPRNPNELMTVGTLKTLLRRRLPAFVKKGKSDVFIYYIGHGAPSTETNEGFLVPYDCDPNFIDADNAYRLQDFYVDLSKIEGRSLTVVLDACFSGMTGDGKMLIQNISPIVLSDLKMPRHPLLSHPRAIVITSTSNDRVSNWYPDKKHSLFTYFFLKGLQGAADRNRDTRITVAELEAYLLDEDEGVPYWSNRLFLRPQTPQIEASDKSKVLVDFKR